MTKHRLTITIYSNETAISFIAEIDEVKVIIPEKMLTLEDGIILEYEKAFNFIVENVGALISICNCSNQQKENISNFIEKAVFQYERVLLSELRENPKLNILEAEKLLDDIHDFSVRIEVAKIRQKESKNINKNFH